LNAWIVIAGRCQKTEETTPACSVIKKTNELDQKLTKRQKTKVKMKSQCAISLKANRGLHLHHFITFINTRKREGEKRGDNT